MEPLHAVVLTVSLFVLTFFNPGANLFVVVQTSLASGRRAGVLTGYFTGVLSGYRFPQRLAGANQRAVGALYRVLPAL